jgi:hypothetical protein
MNEEKRRLEEDRLGRRPWRHWGPYLSERQWGTVREDYSADGDAWNYLPHDHARSRAYRWGEDGLAGLCDDEGLLCLALALWNGKDPILKERLFGLTNTEGNHGEDVKELYYYLDATPTGSYLKMLYKYPQAAFPYDRLVEENRRRGRQQPEYELLDTGVFAEDRYFDVFVEYAKADPDDVLVQVTAHNRGPDEAALHLLPQVWFRNTWSWRPGGDRPSISQAERGVLALRHARLGDYSLHVEGEPDFLFCDNDTNVRRLYGASAPGYFKDACHDYLIAGNRAAGNPARTGTKAAALYSFTVPSGGSVRVWLRLAADRLGEPFGDFDAILARRVQEADDFYRELQADQTDADARAVQRQALAGMVWSKQFYHYDVPKWLDGDPAQPPPPPGRRQGRNGEWRHLNNAEVLSLPDKWEYPWFAAWDLAFHTIPLALIDPEFAKDQLVVLTREWYLHPNGQLPAYEWNFADVNPPVHAWAAWRVFQIDRNRRGMRDQGGDLAFLERVFHKLLLNFTWWVNRKDAQGRNVFQGGFLGLDNIGVFDRSAPLPSGQFLNQADGTAWMAMYCLNLMRIALELALHNHVYEDIATKFFEHFLHIAEAMTSIGGDAPLPLPLSPGGRSGEPSRTGAARLAAPTGGERGRGEGVGLWDPQDEFYYDVLQQPDGRAVPLKVRTMVGLIAAGCAGS